MLSLVASLFLADASAAAELQQARDAVEAHRPTEGVSLTMKLLSESDHSTRRRIGPSAAQLLREAGRELLAGEALEQAAVAFDAAWVLTGSGRDAELATAFLALAESVEGQGQPRQALWLVQQAATAAPDDADVIAADQRLGVNRNGALAWSTGVAGLGLALAGAVMLGVSQHAHDELGTVHSRGTDDALLRQRAGWGAAGIGCLSVGAVAVGIAVVSHLLGRPVADAPSWAASLRTDLQ